MRKVHGILSGLEVINPCHLRRKSGGEAEYQALSSLMEWRSLVTNRVDQVPNQVSRIVILSSTFELIGESYTNAARLQVNFTRQNSGSGDWVSYMISTEDCY